MMLHLLVNRCAPPSTETSDMQCKLIPRSINALWPMMSLSIRINHQSLLTTPEDAEASKL